ncbi:DNA-binding transcriptional regulator, LysR family [Variovorax sp. HW608]|uniref:LysR family transcriptional regulator n=1 Tax=Variovorax sp. HW608 TaxID=1034889 RepID=UPI00081F7FA6|nr:LysR family transcriptional regulator [Variovorax sp. HW608]SCK09826.1 DNA-binding transcriptional regulator, LysR family [Variovorax sp. HW608]
MAFQSPTSLLNRLLARGKFRHIQVLLNLAELGSVQRTAEAVGLTQSSVTQTLAYLEQLLETRLFDRHARGVRPTPVCVDLLPVARQLLLGLASGSEILAARQNQGAGSVRMIGSASAIHGLLFEALLQFSSVRPSIQVHLQEVEGEDQLLAISRDEVDLVVCRQPVVTPEGWIFDALLKDCFVVLCRADHPLAGARKPSLRDLAAQTWLQLPAGLAARSRFDELAAAFPAPPGTFPIVTRSMPMIWWLLLRKNLLALMPLNLARPMLDSGQLAQVHWGPAAELAPIGMLRPESGLGSAAMQLCEFLKERAQTVHNIQQKPSEIAASPDSRRGRGRTGSGQPKPENKASKDDKHLPPGQRQSAKNRV